MLNKNIIFYSHLSPAKKATIWYTLCNIFQKGIAFIVIPIYVRLLTPTEYGNYMTFQAWKDILIIFATLNLYCGVFTKALVDYENDRNRYTSCMQTLSTLLTTLLFVVYLISPIFWETKLEIDTATIILLFLYFVTFPALSFWSVRQRVENKYVRMVFVTLFLSILTPIVSIVLLLNTELREKAVIYGLLFTQIAVGAFFYIKQFIVGKCFYDKFYWLFALKYNIPLIPHYLSLIVLGQVDRIMIKDMVGAAQAGIYSLAYQVTMVMTVFTSAINGSYVPWFYEQLKNKNYKPLQKISNQLCLLVASAVLLIMFVGPEFIKIIGTEEYFEAIWIIPAVSLGVYISFCYSLLVSVEFYYSATTYVMMASLVVSIVKIILNYIAIPIFGYLSAGYTDLLCYILFMVFHYVFILIILKKHGIDNCIFDMRFITASIFVLLGIMLLCLLLYRQDFIRYAIIIILLALSLLNRNKIAKIIKFK